MNRKQNQQKYVKAMKRWLSGHYIDPTETRLAQILGATTIVVGRFRDSDGRPLTFTLSRGHILRSERFRRQLIDENGMFINDLNMALAVMPDDDRRDIVNEYEMDLWYQEHGYTVKWIPRRWLYDNPAKVKTAVLQFI